MIHCCCVCLFFLFFWGGGGNRTSKWVNLGSIDGTKLPFFLFFFNERTNLTKYTFCLKTELRNKMYYPDILSN